MDCCGKKVSWCCSFGVTQALIVTVSCLGYAVVTYHRVCPSILYPHMSEALGITTEDVGRLGSMYFWPYAISQPFIGLLVDIVEPSFVMSAAHLLCTLGSIIVAIAQDFATCSVGRALVGLGAGAIMVPTCKVFANWLTARGFFIFQGLVLASGAAGGVLAQGPLAYLIEMVPWRITFYAAAIVSGILALLTLLYRGTPEKMGFQRCQVYGLPPSQDGLIESLNSGEHPIREKVGIKGHFATLWRNTKKVLSNKYFWTLVLWDGLVPGAYYNISSMWGGPYLREVFNFTEQETADILILINLAWILGTPVLTFVSESLKTRKWVVVITALCEILVSIAFMFINKGEKINNVLVIVLIFMIGFFSSAPCSVVVTMFKEMETPETAGTAMGCSNFFPFICSTIMHSVTAELLEWVCPGETKTYDAYVWSLWVPTLVCAVLGFLGALVTKETYPSQPDVATTASIEVITAESETYTH